MNIQMAAPDPINSVTLSSMARVIPPSSFVNGQLIMAAEHSVLETSKFMLKIIL